MVPDLFAGTNAVDEWSLSTTDNAESKLQNHWETYITADDIKALAQSGINALRIPIGYWAYNNTNTPFYQGQDKYLEMAIGWARKNNMYVWVDCHASPGSQNGQEHSGRQGAVLWQTEDYLNQSTDVLKTIAQKYGAASYANVVVGIELTNEPLAGSPNNIEITRQWSKDAYNSIKPFVENQNLVIVMQDAYAGVDTWIDTANSINTNGSKTYGIDTHEYQLYTDEDNSLNQPQHITKACAWNSSLLEAKASMPVYVGEWSLLTNICLYANGTTTGSTSCNETGC